MSTYNNNILLRADKIFFNYHHIRITRPCDLYPLTPHFYIVKLGCTGVYIFLIFALKHRLWVLIRTASFHNQCFRAKKIKIFSYENYHFYSREICMDMFA